ncbi:TssN family type VI secretion system protein [Hyunsoonleella rubra]|uniref:TssN family type VI secretion system protein n=1 Tax=Hyunsoonleella rubra TaxID=1737062 RepID=A0ABW5TAN0_9FLAO
MNLVANMINGNVFKLSFGFFLVSSILFGVVKRIRQIFAKNKKQAILYLLFILVTFALTALLSSSKVLNDTPLSSFIGMQILFFMLGVLHLFVMDKYFPDLKKDKTSFFYEFLFTIIVLLIGLIAYMNVVDRFRPAFSILFLGSSIFFFVPFLFSKLYEFAFKIPVPIYSKWVYPLGKKIKDPTKNELTNPAVISLEFQKTSEDRDIVNFRIKAPENMDFGKLFYFFINDYNERHPESTIEFLDKSTMQPHEWIFFFKPNWLAQIKHIDYAKTISNNNIKENDVIVCKRVP